MTTPCIVAMGTRATWRGVPCKMDGYESWSGAAIIDRIARDGIASAAHTLVSSVRHGWESIGSAELTEPDEFLGGDAVTNAAPREILERHHAAYVIDVGAARLDVCVFTHDRWLEPATFAAPGAVSLPSWYPQLGPRTFGKRRRPEHVTRELQEQCRSLGLGWGPVCEALRRWLAEQLGSLAGCAWLYLGGTSDEHVRCLIDDTFVYSAIDSYDRCFTGADGRMRKIDIDNVDLAGRMFHELGLPASRALAVIEKWLTLAARHGGNNPDLSAEWFAGSRRWDIDIRGRGRAPLYLPSSGCLPTLLCWLF
jgi:hypothetical protein